MESYDQIENKIQEMINSLKKEGQFSKSKKLQLSDAIFCAQDIVRNKKFYKGIKNAIKKLNNNGVKKINTIDIGSGTGILGIYALFLGANRCTFIEYNPNSLNFSKNLIKKLGLQNKSEFILGDGTNIQLQEKYELIISETIDTTLSKEDFVPIICNVRKNLNKGGIIIPEKISIYGDSGKKYLFDSYKGSINTEKIIKENGELKGEIKIYDNIIIKSGDCFSLINKRNK